MAPGSKITQQEVWGSIAEPWHRARTRMYDDLKEFLRNNTGRNFVLDLGCGSGRSFMAGKKYVGVDFSENMLRHAKQNAEKNGIEAHLVKADVCHLPFKSNSFNTALLVATLHSMEDRAMCLEEMKRVMEKGSEAFVTVWNKNQPRFLMSKKESYVPWKVSGKIYWRYYYLFAEGELRKLLSAYFNVKKIYGGRERVLKLFPKNIIAIVKKM
ncbi:MAG: class I SAM-dependent methyltransferase [Candidatus Aenigmarchaeota archaeon]|nr:class I SAM-dependent methyltransferase [Candidatus Aenigmarchaeota archaeon]